MGEIRERRFRRSGNKTVCARDRVWKKEKKKKKQEVGRRKKEKKRKKERKRESRSERAAWKISWPHVLRW